MAKPSGFRPDKSRAVSFLNGFKNIPGKACVNRVHNNYVFVNKISIREKHRILTRSVLSTDKIQHTNEECFTHYALCRPKPAKISGTIACSLCLEPTSPRRDFFVRYCSHCLQKGLTNQNPLTAHIFLGLRGI